MHLRSKLFVLCILYFGITHQFHFLERNSSKLIKCSQCPPGWGVLKKCTIYTNTACKKCQNAKTYSAIHSSKSPCWPCSRCGIGLYEAHKCSTVKDTVCSECITYIGQKNFKINADFVEKCSYIFIKNN